MFSYQDSVGLEERRHLHQVQNSPDTLLAAGPDQVVELHLLTNDAVGAEAGLLLQKDGILMSRKWGGSSNSMRFSSCWAMAKNPQTVYLNKEVKIITTN